MEKKENSIKKYFHNYWNFPIDNFFSFTIHWKLLSKALLKLFIDIKILCKFHARKSLFISSSYVSSYMHKKKYLFLFKWVGRCFCADVLCCWEVYVGKDSHGSSHEWAIKRIKLTINFFYADSFFLWKILIAKRKLLANWILCKFIFWIFNLI